MRECSGSFYAELRSVAAQVDSLLEGLLSVRKYGASAAGYHGITDRLLDAMRYGVLGGGKRIRAFLTVSTARAVHRAEEYSDNKALLAGAAIECLHCYSLIHDDLPSIDNASLRRGRLALHRVFDEATAILVGDCLQSLAFAIIADADAAIYDAQVRCELISGLAEAAYTMVCGQMMDLSAEGRFIEEGSSCTTLGYSEIRALQAMKTGALMRFSVEAGAIVAQADAVTRERLRRYGDLLGLAYQIADDLLDLKISSEITGKDVAQDAIKGKGTFVALYGAEKANSMLNELLRQAEEVLSQLDITTDLLRFITCLIATRDR